MSDESKSRELPRWARTTLLVLLGLVVVGGIVLALIPSPIVVDAGTVERGTMQVRIEEDGRTRVQDRYQLSAPVGGTLERVTRQVGDEVEEGDILFRIRPTASALLDPRSRAQAQAGLEGARANLEAARARVEGLQAGVVEAERALRAEWIRHEGGGGSAAAVEVAEAVLRGREAEVRSAEFQARAAEQEVEHARLLLETPGAGGAGAPLEVRTPVAGRVLQVLRESEGVVQPGTPILEVGDPRSLELVVDLLSADAAQVSAGAPAVIDRWGGEETLEARVRRVEPSAFTRVSALGIEEQRVNVILDLESPPELWAMLGDGYRIEARITIWEEDDVVIAPANAVFREGGEWFAFRIEAGRAVRVPIEVGRRSDVDAWITEGLEPGDRVVLYPGERIEDGVRIDER
jgi:HlyD family secretion protein